MRIKKFAATSALVIAALGVTAGTVNAAPAQAEATGIHWNTELAGNSVIVKTDIGSLTTEGDQLQVRDDAGTIVTAFPLTFVKNDGMAVPVAAAIDGNTATLTPNLDPSALRPTGLLHDVVRQDAFDDAVSAAATQFGLATSVGTLIGTVVGAGAGCVLGLIGGATLSLPLLEAAGFGPILGCLAGAGIGIPLGAAAGLILTGIPAGIAVGIGFFNRINLPENQ
ncbi:hypothetical protein LTV02_01690 [Nocardia yamanashiensis]|uniref:hypothetical protein n=1 Tax=Nocardia yamanashiensis TaxID=209247 RepID=UPI001E523DE8|nr:hypothetical protein [Nocardia yamanashiensis]UGT42169.1 hypothetical protein LTV02_01690 [Nocardia yamanashiensis]